MAFNVPTFVTNDISFGPAVVFIGPYVKAGQTPTIDIGALGEDGVTFEIMAEKKYLSQGNPGTPFMAFTQTAGAKVSFTSLEWDFDRFIDSLGAGVTAADGPDWGVAGITGPGTASELVYKWGGSPTVAALALRVQHLMNNGNTMDMKVWRCFSDAGFSINFNQDEHQFAMSFTAAVPENGAKTWDGRDFNASYNLIEMQRTVT